MLTSVYIHIPFCTKRCGYCDFNTYAGVNHLIPYYLDALGREIEFTATKNKFQNRIHTIYFGGGTPSLIPVEKLQKVLTVIRNNYVLLPEIEITLEANPGSITYQYLEDLREIGFTRISIGLQSIHANELSILNRKHDFGEARNSVIWAKDAGFEHISLDLIFGIPGQTMSTWKETLNAVTELPIDHISLYSLVVEDGTLLQKQIQGGTVQSLDEDLAGDMYQYALSTLPAFGFEQYEISNWALSPNARSKHNMQYWKCNPYLGFGAGAHGYITHIRYENVAEIIPYIYLIEKNSNHGKEPFPASIQRQQLDSWEEMQEFMMLGVRLTREGISKSEFQNRFSISINEVFRDQVDKLINLKLIENDPENSDCIRLTSKGIIFGNRVFSEFVGNEKPKILNNQ